MAVKELGILIAKFDYNASDGQELDIRKGEKLTLIDDSQHWWKVMNSQNNVGYIPSNYVKRSKQGIFSSLRNTLGRRKNRQLPPYLPNGTENSSNEQLSRYPSTFLPDRDYNTRERMPSLQTGPFICLQSAALPSSVTCFTTSAPHSSYSSIPSPFNSQCDPLYSKMNCNASSVSSTFSHKTGYVVENSWQFHDSLKFDPPTSPACSGKYQQTAHLSNNQPTTSEHNPDSLCQLEKSTCPSNGIPTNYDALKGNVSVDLPSDMGDVLSSLGSHQLCVANFAYTACNSDELSFKRGDYIQVLEKSSDGWWCGSVVPGTCPAITGWFPSNYITTVPKDSVEEKLKLISTALKSGLYNPDIRSTTTETFSGFQPKTVSPLPTASSVSDQKSMMTSRSFCSVPFPFPNKQVTLLSQNGFVCGSSMLPTPSLPPTDVGAILTLFPFSGNEGELSFRAGEGLELLSKPIDDPDWWLCRNPCGQVGLVPRNYVRLISNPPPPSSLQTQTVVNSPPQEASLRQIYRPPCEDIRLQFAMRSSSKSSDYSDKSWYWGAISRSQCEIMLEHFSLPGEFIIRDSESHPGDLTVTMNAGDKNRNFKVSVAEARFLIGQKMFTSVDALIEHYRTHPIYRNDRDKHFLTRPFQHPNSGDFLRFFNASCSIEGQSQKAQLI